MAFICLLVLIAAIFLIAKSLKTIFGPLDTKLKLSFVNGNKNHNQITKIQKGECTLKFKDNKFYIIQGENQLEDNSSDIFHFRIWTFKNALYMAISMKTHSEYMFCVAEPKENNELAISLMSKLIEKIANKLKVEFKDCGESEE